MSVQDYLSAVKIGKKEYHACVNKGTYISSGFGGYY